MSFITTLAAVCLEGNWRADLLEDRINQALFSYEDWVTKLVQRIVARFPQPPEQHDLARFLAKDDLLYRTRIIYRPKIHIYPIQPNEQALANYLPQLHTLGDLSNWLKITPTDLEWFADRAGIAAGSDDKKLRHYHVRITPKRRGGSRLLEVPKAALKTFQRQIHEDILPHLACHPCAYGFRKGQAVVDHANVHKGQAVVLKFDLRDCFLHVNGGKVYHAFRSLGYSHRVSQYLMALCCHRLDKSELNAMPLSAFQRKLAQQNHLPQGAPSSPLLSHAALSFVDKRLHALASSLQAEYSRYADDLVLSGGSHLKHNFRQLESRIGSILAEQGFSLNYRKSRCLTQADQQKITGITVNQHCNIPRVEFDRLKAELTNCVRKGWRSQKAEDCFDYQAHLRGRVNWVRQVNPERAKKLDVIFERINWNA